MEKFYFYYVYSYLKGNYDIGFSCGIQETNDKTFNFTEIIKNVKKENNYEKIIILNFKKINKKQYEEFGNYILEGE